MFDRVFTGESRQIDVYEGTTQRLLDGLLDGYNSTVFAYGVSVYHFFSYSYLSYHSRRPVAVKHTL